MAKFDKQSLCQNYFFFFWHDTSSCTCSIYLRGRVKKFPDWSHNFKTTWNFKMKKEKKKKKKDHSNIIYFGHFGVFWLRLNKESV